MLFPVKNVLNNFFFFVTRKLQKNDWEIMTKYFVFKEKNILFY